MDFYFRLLRPPTTPKAEGARAVGGGGTSATSKNRRLAKLHRLVDGGEYFSDEAMRARAPLLHYHYVAQVSRTCKTPGGWPDLYRRGSRTWRGNQPPTRRRFRAPLRAA